MRREIHSLDRELPEMTFVDESSNSTTELIRLGNPLHVTLQGGLERMCVLMNMSIAIGGLLFALPSLSEAHSHLANPLPTRRLDCRVGNGRHRDCHGPCPALDTYGDPTGVSASRPAEKWRRGQSQTVSWHRNNHAAEESGFVRLSLVPADKVMDKRAHERFTFQISCWSSGVHQCRSRQAEVCGNDSEGKAYKVSITVPSAYPDGVYVFGWAWYGGGNFRAQSFFGDYYSCSFIRIEGGVGVTSESRPIFYPGEETRHSDGCESATSALGQCAREPCHVGPVRKMTPQHLPRTIYSRDLGGSEAEQKGQGREENRFEPPRARQPQSQRSSIKIQGLEIFDIGKKRGKAVNRSTVKVKLSRYEQGFTFVLNVAGNVARVDFQTPAFLHTETKAPYTATGDSEGSYGVFRCHKGNRIHLKCTAFGEDGSQESVSYKIRCQ